MRPARLGDVAVSTKNGIYKPASEYADDGVPNLRMYNIDSGSIVWRDIKRMRVSPAELDEYGLREGDLLVNRVNSRELVGKTAYVPASLGPSVFESKNIRVRVDTSRALPKFINYQLLARGRQHFSGNAQQVVGMASISQKQLADFPIVLTDLDEQRRIVAEIEKQFSRLDEAVANLKRVKVNLKRNKAAVLRAAVEGRLVPTEAEFARQESRSYVTGAKLLRRILEVRRNRYLSESRGKYAEPEGVEPREPLPEGWTWASVDQLLISLRNGLSRKPEDSPPGIPILRISAVRPLDLDLEDRRYYRPHDGEAVTDHAICASDLLFVRYNGTKELVGACALVPAVQEPVLYPDKLIRGRVVADSLVSPGYVALAATVGISRKHIDELIKTTAGQQGISGGEIKRMPIPLPPFLEQQRIIAEVDRRLSIVREVEAEVVANLKRAQALRQSVLSRAFADQNEPGQ